MAAIIVGAGLAGLIAAHAWPALPVVERNAGPFEGHKALLRFRTDAVSKLTGIEFQQVLVRKGLWCRGAFSAPTIALANSYSRKCIGEVLPDRSIWNLEPVQRFVAPTDFYDQLVAAVGSRISWGEDTDFLGPLPYISTAPLPNVLESVGVGHGEVFSRASILVRRGTVPNCKAYQTVYFPGPETSLYRASITGSTLICEFAEEPESRWFDNQVAPAFGIDDAILDIPTHHQRFGKIAPIDEGARKQLLFELTHKHNIYSLGRFATWRNILLDDVVDDIAVIKRLMRGGNYERKRAIG